MVQDKRNFWNEIRPVIQTDYIGIGWFLNLLLGTAALFIGAYMIYDTSFVFISDLYFLKESGVIAFYFLSGTAAILYFFLTNNLIPDKSSFYPAAQQKKEIRYSLLVKICQVLNFLLVLLYFVFGIYTLIFGDSFVLALGVLVSGYLISKYYISTFKSFRMLENKNKT